jgi:hypothetical protein
VTRTNFFYRSVPRKVAIGGVTLRPGTVEDVPAMLRLMDIATDWLVKKGLTGQWGTKRHSDNPARIKQATEKAESGGTWIAVDTNSSSSRTEDGLSGGEVESPYQSTDKSGGEDEELSIINGVVGALTVGQANPYVQPATKRRIELLAAKESALFCWSKRAHWLVRPAYPYFESIVMPVVVGG